MIKKAGNITTYLMVFILLTIGVLTFIYRENLFFTVEDHFVSEVDIESINIPESELVDLSILEDDRFKNMRMRDIDYYDLDDLGELTEEEKEKYSEMFEFVTIGNNRPFR